MEKLLTFVLAVAVSLMTTVLIAGSRTEAAGQSQAQTATDGAFRDGLYIGRMAAEGGRPEHPPIGRWSTAADRASFLKGYRSGYRDAASHAH